MRGRRIPLPLPNTGAMYRRKNSLCIRAILLIFIMLFVILQLHLFNYTEVHDNTLVDTTNDTAAAILSMVPSVFHKFLAHKSRNQTYGHGNGTQNGFVELYHPPNISEIKKMIAKYNELQIVLNEDIFGPLQNDSVIIVVQVHTRITYLKHLIVSLAQARDISRTLLVFSHDYYDEDINDLIQTIDFCKVMQIFYPYSIQTHPHEFPGVDPGDCARDMKKEQALIKKCNNAQHPDLYGHYREAAFTQTKHHWWWKANRVFDQLEITRCHTGLVLFLEEDHYVAEDFLYLLELMQKRALQLCQNCNILSLGTYLKTFNYYTYNSKNKNKAYYGQYTGSSASNNILGNYGNKLKTYQNQNSFHLDRKNKPTSNELKNSNNVAQQTWSYHVLPSLYSVYQKVEVMPWISSKHNMGFAFNKNTWQSIRNCAIHFCNYDDYNWDWSLQHLSQQCLKNKLRAMIVKGPRVFHIGECGVHHKKKNCESNQVISKVQQVLRIAKNSGQMFPKSLTLTVASLIKRTKLRKGNGGWGDERDHELCLNFTRVNR
ncbi:alpha-1,6-mannosyl-glycoprotein 2-beta-N-acetylglucosaminyltransferase isoform X1 [Condylostylus longicornis]|uniref:alpha-1,6-mannosyl-glycoprotein 2-beta-N-acetylglucosaminyltransferase isoform X1 n=1 Tax=Condylostylus longicornis TaxID=2530218 RepID=UPI00244E2B3C|nr:alpha-1,6-mannosyl-glycoprotein 2-beta-N-acetylglucosaminyltransferase isoform X1 [Condylostylus longicornis]